MWSGLRSDERLNKQLSSINHFSADHLFHDDHIRGLPAVASVNLLEYGDFCCTGCRIVYPVIKEVCRRMGDRLCFAFRHFPRTDQPQAQEAALVVEAAGLQGYFWPMHDLLFEEHQELDEVNLLACAGSLGADIEHLRQDLRERRCAARVRRDRDQGCLEGVQKTPTFFINGQPYEGTSDLGSLLYAVQREAGLR